MNQRVVAEEAWHRNIERAVPFFLLDVSSHLHPERNAMMQVAGMPGGD